MSGCICTKTSYSWRGVNNQDPWIFLTFQYLSKVENQYSFYVFSLSEKTGFASVEGGRKGSINKLHKILYIHLWLGQEGWRGKMAAVCARQDTVHLYIQCMPWKHSQADLWTGSSISATSTIKVNFLPGVCTLPRYHPTALQEMCCTDTHTPSETRCEVSDKQSW